MRGCVCVCDTHIYIYVTVSPAAWNFRQLGSIESGKSLGEKHQETIIHELKTLNQFAIHDELSAPVTGITLCTQWDDRAAHT